MSVLRAAGNFILFMLQLGFPILIGVMASNGIKAYFYDKQKYNILRELGWISYSETTIKNRIEKSAERAAYAIVLGVAGLVAYNHYVEQLGWNLLIVFFLFLFGLAQGQSRSEGEPTPKKDMKNFLKEYDLGIEIEKLENKDKA